MKRDIERYAKEYVAEEYGFERVMRRYRHKKVHESLQQFKALHVLEIGCGPNSLAERYNQYERFVIVEPSQDFCAMVKASSAYGPGVEIIPDVVENQFTRLREMRFDFIILSSLLHEVHEPRQMLRGLHALCGPGTILHVNVPNAESFHFLWAKEAGLIDKIGAQSEQFTKLQQTSIFTLSSLIAMLEEEGFVILEQGSYFIKPFNHAKMQKALEIGLLDNPLLDGLYALSSRFPAAGAEIFANCRVARS